MDNFLSDWSRSEIIALIGVVLAFIGLFKFKPFIFQRSKGQRKIQQPSNDKPFKIIPNLPFREQLRRQQERRTFISERLKYTKEADEVAKLKDEEQKITRLIEDLEKRIAQLQNIPSPYKGLYHYEEKDASVFFGRDRFVSDLESAVMAQDITALIGPSGCGKSSVVYAGLFPRIRQKENWLITSFRPLSDPVRNLVQAFVPLIEPSLDKIEQVESGSKLYQELLDENIQPSTIIDLIQQENHNRDHIFLYIDQFEGLFSNSKDRTLQQQFIDLIFEFCRDVSVVGGMRVKVLFSMRADFLDQALSNFPLNKIFHQKHHEFLGAMTNDELKSVIKNPAISVGVGIEEGLVDLIIKTIGNDLSSLPLLAFTLTELWERKVNGNITLANYTEVGEVPGALNRYADSIFHNLGEDEQEDTKFILTQLVIPGRRAKDTKRIASKAELGEDRWNLVSRLASSRLLMTDRNLQGIETAELIHEVLIDEWDSFKVWIEEHREFRIWQEKVRPYLDQWQLDNTSKSKQDKKEIDIGVYLKGAFLDEAIQIWNDRPLFLSKLEINFITASIEHRKQEIKEKDRSRALSIIVHEIKAPLSIIHDAISIIEDKIREAIRAGDQRRLIDIVKWAEFREIVINSKLLLNIVKHADSHDMEILTQDKSRGLVALGIDIFAPIIRRMYDTLDQKGFSRDSIHIDRSLYEIPPVVANKAQIQQVFYNLFTNAIKYSKKDPSQFKININAKYTDNFVEINFQDYGIGVQDIAREMIFKRDFRGSNAMESYPMGQGKGLWISQQLMHSLSGKIRLTNTSNPTEFQILIPRHLSESPSREGQ